MDPDVPAGNELKGGSFPFTDKALRKLRPPTSVPQAFYTDANQPGLQYVLGRGGTGTFYAVFTRGRKRQRERLGQYGEMSLPEARKAHQAVMGRVAEDKATPGDVRRIQKHGLTLREAALDYIAAMERDGDRPKSIKQVRRIILGDDKLSKSYVAAWLDRPLRSIAARECRLKHEEITEKHGPHMANQVQGGSDPERPAPSRVTL